VDFNVDPVFGFEVPSHCREVPDEVLDPASSWSNREEYIEKYRQLATRFIDNFRKFSMDCPPEITAQNPRL
jgi:phosphoenolpyruvate carboxykinase (ATP)